jgi:hypothetical protein
MGTAWELGYYYGKKVTRAEGVIITYSAHGYGSNVMISQSTHLHASNLDILRQVLTDLKSNGISYVLMNEDTYASEMTTTE